MNTFQQLRRTPVAPPAPPATTATAKPRALSRQGSANSNGIVCNVSDDEVVERDVDLEIEARIRNNTLPDSDSESEMPPPPPPPARMHRTGSSQSMPRRTSGASPTRPTAAKSTLSQRMLSALQRRKNQTATAPATRTKRRGSILLEVVQAEQEADMPRVESNHSMGADIDGLVVPDPLYDPSQDPVFMSDDEGTPITHTVLTTSCKDRLEARISDRLLQNKSNLATHPESPHASAAVDPNELAVVYTNRRTYPAESSKKTDPRFSDNHMDARYSRAGVTPEQRANRAAGNYYQQQFGSQQYSNRYADSPTSSPLQQHPKQVAPDHPTPHFPRPQPHQPQYVNIRGPIEPTMEVLDSNKSLPVAFHFQEGHNGQPRARRPGPPAAGEYRSQSLNFAASTTSTRRDFHPSASHATHSREPAPRAEAFFTLSQSVGQIEQVVDGLENCFMASSFSSLAGVALRELELLRESTQQIRTSGTSLILNEVARSHSSQMLGPYRQLVARAAALQHRIDGLIHRIRLMC